MTPQDKRYEEYRRKCAEIMGHKPCRVPSQSKGDPGPRGWTDSMGREGWKAINRLPTYLDDASIDAVVRKLDDSQCWEYYNALVSMFDASKGQPAYVKMHRATAEQKAEALCRTLMGEK